MVFSPLEEKNYNNNNMTSPQMALRHEAAKRAMAAQQKGSSPRSQQYSSYSSPPPSYDQNQNHYREPQNAYTPISSSEIGGSPPLARYQQKQQYVQEQQQQQHRQPRQSRSPASSYATNTPRNENYFSDDTQSYDTEDNNSNQSPETIAQSARKEWRRHGSGVTQVLEENRRGDERAGTFSVRVLSAETRRDVAGAQYTS
jgi:hypothetical protein